MVSYGHTATNTGADADQNCVGLHAPAIPFPTYRKNCSVCSLKLCNAQRRSLTTKPYNSSRALQTNHRTPETRIPTSITPPSPFPHLLRPSIDGGCQCSPKETSSTPHKMCVLSLRVCLLVLTPLLSPQNDSVPVASPLDYPLPVAMTPIVQTRSNTSKRSITPSITNETSKRLKKTTSSARYALDPCFQADTHSLHFFTLYISLLLCI